LVAVGASPLETVFIGFSSDFVDKGVRSHLVGIAAAGTMPGYGDPFSYPLEAFILIEFHGFRAA
jgi:hypothetical protein